jgi:hypothetical protein
MKQLYKIFQTLLLVLLCSGAMAQYCLPTYSTGCTYGDGLTLFQLGTINQTITCTASYHDFTASSTNLTIGNAYTITVQAGYSSTYVNVYIDYNHNNTFDASELIGQVICSSSATNYTITFTVPGTALTGSTRLRALTEWIAYPSGPCTAQSYGNCEDFTVNLIGASYCTPTYSTGCTFGDGLTNFNLNTINQAISCNGSPNPWYHDWTASTTTLMLNTPYTLTVVAGYSSTYVSVWIDYNNDYTFSASERVVTDLVCTNSGVNYTATINIPLGTTLGNHRLRFRTDWASSSADPCATYSYGNAGDFTVNLIAYVPPSPPTVVTTAASLITGTTATLNGTVNANNATTTTSFDYGLTTTYGTTVPGVPVSVSGNTVTAVSAAITGLAPNTLYHYRIDGVNSVGSSNGNDMTFTTAQIAPTVVTTAATGVTNVAATMNGTVNANNTSTNVFFDWGLTAAYGSTVAGVPSPVNGSTVTNVSAGISGLTINTTYHFRVRGVNAAGTSNGNDMTFFTVCNAAGAAGTITGPTQVCNGGTGYIYTVPAITNASGYNWTLPFGGIITAGANTNTITVSYPNQSYSGNLIVYGIGCAGNGSPSYLAVYVNSNPVPTISGPTIVCAGNAGNVYTTQSGMSNYVWTVAGGTITAGGTTTSNTATVTWNTAGTQTISVNYNNAAGCPAITPTTVNVTVNPMPVPVITGNANPCSALPTVYSAQTGMSGYNWTVSAGGTITAGNGTSSITVVWSATGAQNVYLTYTNTNGCTNTTPASYAVTVKQGPAPSISGSNNLCVNSGYYNYTTQAGMTGYTWNISSGGVIISGGTTNTVTVNWTAAGSQSINVNYTNANGCAAPSPVFYPVTVTALPGPAGPISGPANVCEGGTNYVYTVTTIPNTHAFIWTVPTGATIVGGQYSNSITVDFALGAPSGNITVYGNSMCGNGTTSPPFPVTVNLMPAAAGTIIGPNTLCQGVTGIGYTVPAITDATGYMWSLPAGATIVSGANTNSIVVDFSMFAVSGNITVYGTNNCGNGTVSPSFVLTMLTTPQTPVITLSGDTLTSDAPAGNQWYLDGTLIPGATNQSYVAAANGIYTDIVTLNGCSSALSNQIQVIVIGINPNQGPEISVYPVPNDGKFTISITSASTESFTLSVINNLGVEVYLQKDVAVAGTVDKLIDLRPVPSGIYTLIIRNSQNQVIRKILVNK